MKTAVIITRNHDKLYFGQTVDVLAVQGEFTLVHPHGDEFQYTLRIHEYKMCNEEIE